MVPAAEMSTEVSGEAEGVTLIEAIEAGRIATPGELSFPQWQAWRKGPGMRPTMRRDGRGISTRDEVDLWRRVMEHLYGAGRAGELEEEDDGPEGREIALQGSASGAPSVAASEGERRDEDAAHHRPLAAQGPLVRGASKRSSRPCTIPARRI